MLPPKGCYLDRCDYDRFSDELAGLWGQVNLYIHIPFCAMKCSFCTLFTSNLAQTDHILANTSMRFLEEITLLFIADKYAKFSYCAKSLRRRWYTIDLVEKGTFGGSSNILHKTFSLTDCGTVYRRVFTRHCG